MVCGIQMASSSAGSVLLSSSLTARLASVSILPVVATFRRIESPRSQVIGSIAQVETPKANGAHSLGNDAEFASDQRRGWHTRGF